MGRQKLYPEGEHAFRARIPVNVWNALRASAKKNRRSLNAELVWLLERQLLRAGRRPKKD